MNAPRAHQSLADLGAALDDAHGLADAAQALAAQLCVDVPCDHAGVWLHVADDEPDQLALVSGEGSSPILATGLAGLVAATGPTDVGRARVVDVTDSESPGGLGWGGELLESGLLSAAVLGMPTVRRRAVTLGIASDRAHAFGGEVLDRVRLSARFGGEVLRRIDQVANLRVALESRSMISRAQGILMERFGLSEDLAVDFLKRRSHETRVAVRDLAAGIVAEMAGPERSSR